MRTFEQYRLVLDFQIAASFEGFYNRLAAKFGQPQWPDQPGRLLIIGIRHDGVDLHNREDKADDLIVLLRLDSDGNQQVHEWPGTTESGDFSEVINREGDFRLDPGFYFFKKGLHHGTHSALVQADAVRGERAVKGQPYNLSDSQKWEITDGSLHIHAGIKNLNHVGNWSAGCQVIAGGWDGDPWKAFMKYVDLAIQHGQKTFCYVLVDESNVRQLLKEN